MEKAISSLAILKVNWDKNKRDYLETFIPFIATLIKKTDYKTIEVGRIREDFTSEYGLKIPHHPMVSILERARKRGLIKSKRRGESFVPVPERIAEIEFSQAAIAQQGKFVKVCQLYKSFVSARYSQTISDEQAEASFILFLKEHDIEVLFGSQNQSVLPTVTKTMEDRFFIHSFVRHVYNVDQETFQFVVDLAVGHILANTLLYDGIANYQGRLRGLDFYLDTPLVFRFLGVHGAERQGVYKDYVMTLQEEGARLFMFRHSYDEMIGILNECQQWIDNPKYDPELANDALKFFKENNFRSSDIERLIVSLDGALEAAGVAIAETPDIIKMGKYLPDLDKLKECILNEYKARNPYFGEGQKEYTIQRDVDSISYIHLLRKGSKPRQIRSARCILLTTNYSLAHANKIFEVREYGPDHIIPACLTDVFIGTLVWLQSPALLTKVNEKKVIADCYAALQPSKELVRRYIEELEILKRSGNVSEQEVYLLRTHRVAYELLEEKTLGDPDNFTDRTPQEILRDIETEIRKEEQTKLLKEQNEHARTKRMLADLVDENIHLQKNVRHRCRQIASICSYLLYGIIFALFLIGTILQLFSDRWTEYPFLRWTLISISTLVSVVSILGGFNFKDWRVKLSDFLYQRICQVVYASTPDTPKGKEH